MSFRTDRPVVAEGKICNPRRSRARVAIYEGRLGVCVSECVCVAG